MENRLILHEELDENANVILKSDGFVQSHSDCKKCSLTPVDVKETKGEGIYVCAKCSNEIFSSLDRICASVESLPNFNKTIKNGVLQRIPVKDSINSFQVACSRCLNHVGDEMIHISHLNGQPTSHFTIVDNDALLLVTSGGRRKS